MVRFKPGDRVRSLCDYGPLEKGAVYTVAACDDWVWLKGLADGGWDEARFKLVPPEPEAVATSVGIDLEARVGVDPKQSHGARKPPLGLIPGVASIQCALALQHGADKYGAFNWRDTSKGQVYSYMTYLHGMKRHIDALIDRCDLDPESGCHQLAHVMAGCSIVLDAAACNTLKDDRPPKGATAEHLVRFTGKGGAA
jgi:hypothetical protein